LNFPPHPNASRPPQENQYSMPQITLARAMPFL
jgi:hypothetical protein